MRFLAAGLFCLIALAARADSVDLIIAANAANDGGDFDHALALFDKALQDDTLGKSERATAYDGRGVAWLGKGDVNHALADINQALELVPGFAAAFSNRGNVYLQRGQPDLAIADYNRALTLDPRQVKVYGNRGSAWYASGDPEHAIADFSKALGFDHDSKTALLGRSAAYQLQNRYDLAIADLNRVLVLHPGDPYAYNNRGNAYRGKGDFKRAIADLTHSLSLIPSGATVQLAQVYRGRAKVWQDMGKTTQALSDYAQALVLLPDDMEAGRSRGLLYLEARQFEPALADFNKALVAAPNQPYVLLWRYLARQQLHQDADMELAQANGPMLGNHAWPYPILAYYQRAIPLEQLRAAVLDGDAAGLRGRQCEAAAYIGSYALVHDEHEIAVKMLREAVHICPHAFVEYALAKAELAL